MAEAPSPETRPPEAPRRASREALLFSVLFAAVALVLVFFTWSGVYLLSGVRAYGNAESLYTDGRKDAARALRRYVATGEEAAWEGYRTAIAVPLAGGRVRRLLLQEPPDLAGARAALIEGRNHPDDTGVMIRLFLHARWLEPAEQALSFWEGGDDLIDLLTEAADGLRTEMAKPRSDPATIATLLAEVERIDTEMNDEGFADVLGNGARQVEGLLVAMAGLSGLLLLAIGVLASNRLVARMRAREVRFRSMIENATDVVTILDDRGVTLFMSPAIDRVFGWKPEDLVGTPVFDQIHPDDHVRVAQAIGEGLADPSIVRELEIRFRHRDGSWRTIAVIGSTYVDETGQRRVIANVRDITPQRELEGRLAQAGRLESVGRLAGGVAHDFNNHLTAILGAAESAREVVPASSPAREDLEEIVTATGRAADLTRQLLAFARRQAVEPVVFDLGETVGGLESMLRRLLDETIELSIEAPARPARVRADRAQIEQVILNLAVNARDAMPGGGRLSIRVDTVAPEPQTAARETEGEAGPFTRLEVVDTGHAMEPEVLERIFEPFFSTKESAHGTGLGLATTYGIVKQSRGHITVTSEPGRGSCFRVYLPLSESGEPASSEAPAAERVRGDETILLVEDQLEVRRVTAKTLRTRGFDVLEAGDGLEALARIEDGLASLEALVTDVVMPRMGGPNLAEQLRAERPDLPVVFISGYTDDEPLLERAGQHTVLVTKPFSADELVRAIRSVLD